MQERRHFQDQHRHDERSNGAKETYGCPYGTRPCHVQSQNHLQKEWSNYQKHTHDQWRSATRISMSKRTNPCYMTHRVLKARMNYCINQNRPKKSIQAKHLSPLMPLSARHSFSKGLKCFEALQL